MSPYWIFGSLALCCLAICIVIGKHINNGNHAGTVQNKALEEFLRMRKTGDGTASNAY